MHAQPTCKKGGSGGGILGTDRGIGQITRWTHTTKNSGFKVQKSHQTNKQQQTLARGKNLICIVATL